MMHRHHGTSLLNLAFRMHMGEYTAVMVEKHLVPGHPHVRFEVRGRLSVFVVDPEAKQDGLSGAQRCRVMCPDHVAAVTELSRIAGGDRRSNCRCDDL